MDVYGVAYYGVPIKATPEVVELVFEEYWGEDYYKRMGFDEPGMPEFPFSQVVKDTGMLMEYAGYDGWWEFFVCWKDSYTSAYWGRKGFRLPKVNEQEAIEAIVSFCEVMEIEIDPNDIGWYVTSYCSF